MSLNSTLKTAFAPIAPTEADVYRGPDTTYIVFNYNSIPADFADDTPGHERFLIQAHLYCPLGVDSLVKRKAIKAALVALGTTWPEYINASDKAGQHHVFECELALAAGAE